MRWHDSGAPHMGKFDLGADAAGNKEKRMALIKKEIGELLVDNGLITADELKIVQQERRKTGEPISLILSRLGLANESHLKNALELQFNCNYVSLAKTKPDFAAMDLLPEKLIRQHQ